MTKPNGTRTHLADIIGQKFGYFSQDVNPSVVMNGAQIHTLMEEVAAERL